MENEVDLENYIVVDLGYLNRSVDFDTVIANFSRFEILQDEIKYINELNKNEN